VRSIAPDFHIDKVIFGGSAMSNSDVEWLRNECGAKRVSSIVAANDGGQFGYQCSHMSGRLHHAIDEYNFIEIVDEDGNRVADGTAGKILITSLKKFAYPLIRYEIGDMGRIVPGSCGCGRTDRQFEFLGRASDSFIMGGAISRITDFKDALKDLAISDLQLEATTRDHYDHLTLRVEAAGELIAEQVTSVLFDKMPILKRKVVEKTHGFSVEVYGIGHFDRNARSGKIKEFLDNRETNVTIKEHSHVLQ
jgi:phenylacetate-CoA ligase